jgi:hypothetical protein
MIQCMLLILSVIYGGKKEKNTPKKNSEKENS